MPAPAFHERTFAAPDGVFHYLDWGGDGPLLHLDHATGFCAQTYAPLAVRLSGALRVVAMDARGHGQTTAPADPARLRGWDVYVEDLARFVEHLAQPVVAMGHSRGGVVAALLAARRPELVSAVVLVDPTILPRGWRWPWLAAKKLGLAGRIAIAARAARRSPLWPDRETLLASYRDRPPFAAWQPGFLEGYVAGGTVDGEAGQARLACAPAWEARTFANCPHDVWRELPAVAQPTFVLYGTDSDTFLPAAARRFARQLPGAQLAPVPGTGHFLPMERPDQTAAAVLRFLRQRGLLRG